ncbi:hypothetical protein FOZ61_003173 [Perkinsus olseni]|uniref:Uncharacterized protein n=2 Tax=Perkinsus olseni TaxID=32597 RepID=A0A7J6LQG5_PEROL|nr:hypothetical protein FOZ61_003173 [Perkinsus olseni]
MMIANILLLTVIATSLSRGYDLSGFSGQVERQLQESCGQDCVTAWSDEMLPMLEKFQAKEKGQHGADDVIPLAIFDVIADLNGKLKTARQAILRDVASFAKSGDPATHSLSLAITDTDIQEQKNRCTYVRQVASEAYEASRIIVHTMASSLAVLCGCVFTPVKSECTLRENPYTCGFPYRAYESLYYTSEMLWEAVKMSNRYVSERLAALSDYLSATNIGQVERQLQESCGQDCVTAWRDKMLPMLEKFQANEKGKHGANNVIPLAVFDMIADLNGKLKTARQAILRDVASFAKSGDPATHSLSLAVTDTDIQEQKNRCTYVRQVASEAYEASRIIVHTMASSLAVLCGCVFTPVKSECTLKENPYTCGFPYRAYESLYYTSEMLWEAVKMTTNMCRIN